MDQIAIYLLMMLKPINVKAKDSNQGNSFVSRKRFKRLFT